MSIKHIGFIIPEFPQQTHIAWWRVSQGMQMQGLKVSSLSTRKPRESCPHPVLTEYALETVYLWPPGFSDIAKFHRLLKKAPTILSYVFSLKEHVGLGRLRSIGFVIAALRLQNICKKQDIDHIFIHSCADAAHVGALCKLMGGPGYTLRLGGDLEVYGGDHDLKMRDATLIVPAAKSYEKRLVSEVCVEPHRVMWSWVGTDTDFFKPDDQVNLDSAFINLITVARLNQAKGYDYIIPALATLRDRGLEVVYTIVGEGPYSNEIVKLVKKFNLADQVQLLGSISAEKIALLHRSNHLFVLPTSGLGEGTPAAICEAMSSGLPVLATDTGGIREMVDEEIHGFVVPPADEIALAEAIQKFVANREQWKDMRNACRKKARAEFDYRIVARTIIEKINKLG